MSVYFTVIITAQKTAETDKEQTPWNDPTTSTALIINKNLIKLSKSVKLTNIWHDNIPYYYYSTSLIITVLFHISYYYITCLFTSCGNKDDCATTAKQKITISITK